MKYYLLDALAPLVFRSGKPFGAQSDTEDIVFPLPSAAAGLVRTIFAHQSDFKGEYQVDELKKIAVRGLFLAQFSEDENPGSLKIEKIFVPKPNDALYLKDKDTTVLMRLAPKAMPENCGCDLPDGLLPVQMEDDSIKGKPQKGASFWSLEDLIKWQNNPLEYDVVNKNGTSSPTMDTRTHVAIDAMTQTSDDGKLFQTTAYDLSNPVKKHHNGWEEYRYGFVIATEIATEKTLREDAVRFGGEGRLSYLQEVKLENNFRLPENIIADIQTNKRIKLTLLTPAIFDQGWLPDWLDKETLTGTLPYTSIKVKLTAAAIDRWQAISGWDLANHSPKPTYKAVAAGAVYWFEIMEESLANVNANELTKLAYHSICAKQNAQEETQRQKDGFGIVAVAAWNPPKQSN